MTTHKNLVTEFEVTSFRTIIDPEYPAPETRGEAYLIDDASIKTADGLLKQADDCYPLALILHNEYDNYRLQIGTELAGGGNLTPRRRKALEKRWAAMPDAPAEGLTSWIESMGSRDFAALKRTVLAWLRARPDGDMDESYADIPTDGQSSALQFFQCLGGEECDLLGVVIVEGDHPGSSYFAAELRQDTAAANRIARKHGIPVRFRPVND